VTDTPPLHLAVALDGAGWHPAAWREPDACPNQLFTAAYWAGLAAEAERALLDFITIEDSLVEQPGRCDGPDPRAGQVRGRLDAVLAARRIAPSSTPRPPQGRPLVTALAHAAIAYRFAARSADVVYVTPRDAGHARAIVDEVRAEQEAAGRGRETLHVFGDLVVFLGETEAGAAGRKARLDGAAGAEYASDALIFTGTPARLAELLLDWQRAGLTGFRLRPGALPRDLLHITRGLVPELQRTHSFRTSCAATSLRERLGLPARQSLPDLSHLSRRRLLAEALRP
jgi:hypothetical protein